MNFRDFLLTESINDKGIFKAMFTAGHPGAGKSYVISKISGGVEPRIVNSDTWTEFLKVKGSEWDFFQEKIKILTKEQLVLYINSMLPLWVDGTSSSPPSIFRREGTLKSFGYDTGMVWVNTSLETAIQRAKDRETKIGRHVDEEFIRKTYDTINKLKPYYKSHFDFFVEVNNDIGELTEEAIVKAYKKTHGFFTAPLENPIGKANIEKMKVFGGKYLVDSGIYDMDELKNITSVWFKSN